MQECLGKYLSHKDRAFLLFDNIDKGWSSGGVSDEDLAIVSSLIEAARKIERELQRKGCTFNSAIFLRSDVLDLLIKALPDRGKDSNVSVDWHDISLLKEVFRKRLNFSMNTNCSTFEEIWGQISELTHAGEESFSFAVSISLYRPRFLIALLDHVKSFAVNLGKQKMDTECFEKGARVFSADLVTDISREIVDIVPQGLNILYSFVDDRSELLEDRLKEILTDNNISTDQHEKVIQLLLYFAVIGILDESGENTTYIYDVNYNLDVLQALGRKAWRSNKLYQIHPAFWPALRVKSDLQGAIQF